jgi:hypothetical protein
MAGAALKLPVAQPYSTLRKFDSKALRAGRVGYHCFSSFVIVLTPPTFSRGENYFIARLHSVEHQPILYFKFLGSSTGISANRPALCLLDRNLTIGFVDLADRSSKFLLSIAPKKR